MATQIFRRELFQLWSAFPQWSIEQAGAALIG
jgi:hypothetical protein